MLKYKKNMGILEKLAVEKEELTLDSVELLSYYIKYGNKVKERVRKGLILDNLDLINFFLWKDDEDLVSDLLLFLSTSVDKVLKITKSAEDISKYLKTLRRDFRIQASRHQLNQYCRPKIVSFEEVTETGHCPIENTKFLNDDHVSAVLKSIVKNDYVSIIQDVFKGMELIIYLPLELSNREDIHEKLRRIGLENPDKRSKTLVILVDSGDTIRMSSTNYEGFKSFKLGENSVNTKLKCISLVDNPDNSKFICHLEKSMTS